MTWVVEIKYQGFYGETCIDSLTVSGNYSPQDIQKKFEARYAYLSEKLGECFKFERLEILTLDEWAKRHDATDTMEETQEELVVGKVEPLDLKKIVPADELDNLIEL